MRIYWDTSALLDAILNVSGASTFFHATADKLTRCHTLAESFSHLTGGRLGFRMLPGDAARKIGEFAARMAIVSLNPEQTLSALAETNTRGIRGGAVHDFLHVYAAELHRCTGIVTGNLSDFRRLTHLEVIPPEP